MLRRIVLAFSGVATGAGYRPPQALPSVSPSRSLSFYSTPPELRPFGPESTGYLYPKHQYNRVERIILVRHGESLGNVDESSYGRMADWRIPLTDAGREQSRAAGRAIRELLDPGETTKSTTTNGANGTNGAKKGGPDDGRKIFFYVSPYLRTRQTLRSILDELDLNSVIGLREEPRISEQQFGNFQCFESVKVAKAERGDFGRFYYRFPNGESGFDVYNRVSSFISTIFRDIQQLQAEGHDLDKLNLCIVTHGLALRLILMRWFQYTVHEFEESLNPENGSVVVLERHTNPKNGLQWYELTVEAREKLNLPAFFEQSRFKVADDLSLLERDWDEPEVVKLDPVDL